MQEADTPNYNTTTRFSILGYLLLGKEGIRPPFQTSGASGPETSFPKQPARPWNWRISWSHNGLRKPLRHENRQKTSGGARFLPRVSPGTRNAQPFAERYGRSEIRHAAMMVFFENQLARFRRRHPLCIFPEHRECWLLPSRPGDGERPSLHPPPERPLREANRRCRDPVLHRGLRQVLPLTRRPHPGSSPCRVSVSSSKARAHKALGHLTRREDQCDQGNRNRRGREKISRIIKPGCWSSFPEGMKFIPSGGNWRNP